MRRLILSILHSQAGKKAPFSCLRMENGEFNMENSDKLNLFAANRCGIYFSKTIRSCTPYCQNPPPAPKLQRRKNSMQIEGKAAVVTGGGTGVGRATALELARRGCSVL